MRLHESTEIQDALNSNKSNILAAATGNIPVLNRQEDLQVGSGRRIIDDTNGQIMKGHNREVCKVHQEILKVSLPVPSTVKLAFS
jgi:hypothetical protein